MVLQILVTVVLLFQSDQEIPYLNRLWIHNNYDEIFKFIHYYEFADKRIRYRL